MGVMIFNVETGNGALSKVVSAHIYCDQSNAQNIRFEMLAKKLPKMKNVKFQWQRQHELYINITLYVWIASSLFKYDI